MRSSFRAWKREVGPLVKTASGKTETVEIVGSVCDEVAVCIRYQTSLNHFKRKGVKTLKTRERLREESRIQIQKLQLEA